MFKRLPPASFFSGVNFTEIMQVKALSKIILFAIIAIFGIVLKSFLIPRLNSDSFLDSCSRGDNISEFIKVNPEYLSFIDENGWSCLINASKNGKVELVKLLLKQGAKTELSDGQHTAIRGAGLNGHLEVVQLLIEAGANVNAFSSKRKTALMGAAMNGHERIVKLLLQHGADPNLINEYGETASVLAEKKGYLSVSDLLRSIR